MFKWALIGFAAGGGLAALITASWLDALCDADVSARDAAVAEASIENYELGWQMVDDVSGIDRRFHQEMELQNAEIDRLARAIDAGDIRLRVTATCDPPMPTPAAGSGVDYGGTATLTGEARQAYTALVAAEETALRQLRGCQAWIRTVKGRADGVY